MFCANVNTIRVSCVKTSHTKFTLVNYCWIHKMFGLKVTEYFVLARGRKRTQIAKKSPGLEWII